MPLLIWIVLGALLVAFLGWKLLIPSLDKVVDRAVKLGDPTPVLETIGRKHASARPNAYNHAIRRMWDGYQRAMATELVKELAKHHGTTAIAQYWIRQVLTVEPSVAKERFTRDFLDAYYQPEVAAKCGQVG